MDETITGVVLPDSGIIDTEWAASQLERVSAFSQELLNYGKGQIFSMLKTNLSIGGFEQAVSDLDYTVETALKYINYLQKRPVLEALKDKYYVALSLSASEIIPEDVEDAIALADVCLARFGKLTADNLRKAAETTGVLPKKMTSAAITVEAKKKKALYDWLNAEHGLTPEDISLASSIDTTGKTEFLDKMLAAYDRLEDWSIVYQIIAKPIHDNGDMKALRFLADINDASGSITTYLQSEAANYNLQNLKDIFENDVYPKLQFDKEQL